jgi:5-methylcytosine-specific restriction endonuclease McrA
MTCIVKEYIKKDSYGQKRSFVDFKCDSCKKPHCKEKRFLNEKNYCSVACFNSFRYKDVEKFSAKCCICNVNILRNLSAKKRSKSGLFFCSKKCKDEGQKLKNNIQDIWPSHYGSGDGSRSYRKIALSFYENKCVKCGYTKVPEILQVHHIDHNRSNNNLNNLQILCPNCHSIEHLCKKRLTL